MFFIGIFGIYPKREKIKRVEFIECSECKNSDFSLIEDSSVFEFFFIPVFKFNKKYFLNCQHCNSIFVIDKERARDIVWKNTSDIDYWYLSKNILYRERRCQNCNSILNDRDNYCPVCGERV